MNKLFQEYKRTHSKECTVEFVDNIDKNYKIQGFAFTPEELQPKQKYNRAKDKREYQKRIEEDIENEFT